MRTAIHYPAPAPDPTIYLNSVEYFLAFVLVWSLMGLWIYMNARQFKEDGWLLTTLCGPSAWLSAIWHFTRRKVATRKKSTALLRENWETPINERWKN